MGLFQGRPRKVQPFEVVPSRRGRGRASRPQVLSERDQHISRLLGQYLTQAEIARRLGISQSVVSKTLARIDAYWRESAAADMDARKRRELRELDDMEREVIEAGLTALEANDLAMQLQAFDRRLKVKERRAKLLGLDAPTKVAPTNPAGDEAYEFYTDLSNTERARILVSWFESGAAPALSSPDAADLPEGMEAAPDSERPGADDHGGAGEPDA